MFELKILRADLTVYLKVYFDTNELAQSRLSLEQAQPTWDSSFSSQIIDHTPASKSAAEIAADAAKQAKLSTIKARLQALDDAADLTVPEVKENVRKLLSFLRTKGLLD